MMIKKEATQKTCFPFVDPKKAHHKEIGMKETHNYKRMIWLRGIACLLILKEETKDNRRRIRGLSADFCFCDEIIAWLGGETNKLR